MEQLMISIIKARITRRILHLALSCLTATFSLHAQEQALPHVELIAPRSSNVVIARSSNTVTEGTAISLSAEASDRNGKIERVEFWVTDMATFVSPSRLVATVTAPPYTASIGNLKPGHYMVFAIAFNDRGGSTQSVPAHIMIEARK